MNHKHFNTLRKALLENPHDGYNLGAIVLDKHGQIISWGFNSYIKTHPAMVYNKYYRAEQIFVHAECDALYSMSEKLTPHTMYIARINSKGEFRDARPCVGCYHEIKQRGIKRVYYTTRDGFESLDLAVDVEEYEG